MEDIILINLNSNNIKYFKNRNRIVHRKFFIEPVLAHLGLASLSAAVKEKGFAVKVIDAHLFSLRIDEIINLLIENSPKVIGISVNTPILPLVFSFIKEFRRLQKNKTAIKDTKIVVGGYHITAMPQAVFELGADFGCLGEAEISFSLLCDYIINNKGNLSGIEGLAYIDGNSKILGSAMVVENLNFLASPRYDLYLLPNNISFGRVDFVLMPIQMFRGCIYNCSFCPNGDRLDNKRVRFKSASKVLKEIDDLQRKFSFRALIFVDETFTFDKNEVMELITLLRQRSKKIRWICETRIDLVDKELLTQMMLAGCQRIGFGVESGNQKVRANLGKDISDKHCSKIFRMCRNLGINTTVFLMVGLPLESDKQLQDTLDIPYVLGADHLRIQLFNVAPGTKIYEECVKSGRIGFDAWHKYMRGEINLPSYVSDDLDLKRILGLITKTYLKFYLRPQRLIKEFDRKTSTFWLQQWWQFKIQYKFNCVLMIRTKIILLFKKFAKKECTLDV